MDTESRLEALERDMVQVKANLAVILSNYATKQDIADLRAEFQKEINALTWKMYGFATVLVAAVYFIARNVH
jgi:hypothetical protein